MAGQMFFVRANKFYIVTAFLLLADLLSYFLSISLAYISRVWFDSVFENVAPLEFSYTYFLSLWWIPLIFTIFFAYEGLYSKRFLFWDEIREFLKTITLSALVLFSIVSLAKMSDHVSRLTIVFLVLYMALLVPVCRYLAKKLMMQLGVWQKNVLIYGAGETGINVEWAIRQEQNLGWHIVGFLNDNKEAEQHTVAPVLGSLDELSAIANKQHVDIVIMAIPSLEPSRLKSISMLVQQYAKVVYAVPDIKGIALPNADLYRVYSRQLLLLKLNNNLNNSLNIALKWLLDRLMILLLALPLGFFVLALSIFIKLDSRGGVFYSHERVGKNGKKIKVYKFRSMYIDASKRLDKILQDSDEARQEWQKYHKLRNDPRVTRVGKILRKYSLDELPQVFNVLIGNMSFVGPRPVLEKELADYYKETSKYYLMVHPGITGLWQVSGRNDTTYDMRVALDSWYVQNWSAWLDIVILFKTFKAVLSKDGAY